VAQGEVIFLYLLAVGRSAFGVDLAFRRLVTARDDFDATADAAGIEPGLRMSNEMHALFIYADSFWDNLNALRRVLPGLSLLGKVCDSNAQAAQTVRTARNHVEHFAERIGVGGPKRGVVKRFDVGEIRDAVVAAQMDALRALEERLT
jgi:hypothetical protein